MNEILFFIVILLANIIQGITGFAGTILAMPPSLILVGYGVAKPVLNVLGTLSGIYVFFTHGKHVDWKEVKKIVCVMSIGIFTGIFLKSIFADKEEILYKCLGIFVILLAIQGMYQLYRQVGQKKERSKFTYFLLLISSGIVHGMFVCGGPLLIGYLSQKIKEKVSFRATISTVWIVLNTLIMFDDIRQGMWGMENMKMLLCTIPFLFGGMFIGAKLYSKMSQKAFMKITYILLVISGFSLFLK